METDKTLLIKFIDGEILTIHNVDGYEHKSNSNLYLIQKQEHNIMINNKVVKYLGYRDHIMEDTLTLEQDALLWGEIIMANYYVTFTKKEIYEVEANSTQEAEDIALSILEDDTYAFLEGPPDEIIVERRKI